MEGAEQVVGDLEGGDGVFVAGIEAQDEGAQVSVAVEVAVGAVGPAALLADLLTEPRRERAAEDGVGEVERDVVVVVGVQGRVADVDLRLRPLGLVDLAKPITW